MAKSLIYTRLFTPPYFFALVISIFMRSVFGQPENAAYHSFVLLDESGIYTSQYLKTLIDNGIHACEVNIPSEFLGNNKTYLPWQPYKNAIRAVCISDFNNSYARFWNSDKGKKLDEELWMNHPRSKPNSNLEKYLFGESDESSISAVFSSDYYSPEPCNCPL